ncbi:coatomer subunit beta'-2-like isoform X1 [Triticum urartu]|uniref:coatomer subunit beta'-2-like isoform X1 n=1 Tax=Triticum urartu TaxID=4572 RepID=UPI002043AA79|nr:coatomer subunit beta'-2-like isoform X1 [Triticum urartu]
MGSCLLDASGKIGRELLGVHPLQLRFPFEPNKLIPCQLNLTNNSDEYVDFRCVPKNPKSFLNGLSRLHGSMLPNTSCIYVVTMEKHQQPPANMVTLDVILESWVGYRYTCGWGMDDYFSTGSQEDLSGCPVQKVTLKAVCEPASKMMASEPIKPRMKVMYCRDGTLSEILSMDVHPTKPWILAAHGSGHVSIWNYETQERVMSLRPVKEPAPCAGDHWMLSAKFIAREEWFVAGDGYGYIHVLSSAMMDEITQFKAHTGWVESLAIHPSHPLVLSASNDSLIKLWNWETDWSCIQIFEAHSRNVQQIKFNPLDGNTFASASKDGTTKIWCCSSPIPIATLDCDGGLICVDYFSPGGDRQYVVTGSDNGVAQIWDLQTKKCIQELKGLQHMSGVNVGVIDGMQGHPVLITS